MVGCHKESSDIDIVLYGEKNGRKLIKNFKNSSKDKRIHLYNKLDSELIFSRRYKNRSFDN